MSKTSAYKKLQRIAQDAAGAGWNQHVSPKLRKYANKVIRRYDKRDIERKMHDE
ncbi:MAG: hypothetical protein ABIH21_01710 [Patescibacteria group bacterium]